MATTESRPAMTSDDATAIAELEEAVARQRAAFLADPFPALEERQQLLGALAGVLMSHCTPGWAEAMREMVHGTFDQDRVDVVVGGIGLARVFLNDRGAPEIYTGSPAIGREVAKAAAEQLVPVTLELGGKCPAILADDSI